jgi:hypothetical protein
MCLEADPDFRRLSLRPWIYEFSNGRMFIESLPVYGSTGITDDFGNAITDDFGTQIQSDTATSAGSASGADTSGMFPVEGYSPDFPQAG